MINYGLRVEAGTGFRAIVRFGPRLECDQSGACEGEDPILLILVDALPLISVYVESRLSSRRLGCAFRVRAEHIWTSCARL